MSNLDEGAVKLLDAVRKAVQLADIASDWNLYEVEIDGLTVPIYDLKHEFQAALSPPADIQSPLTGSGEGEYRPQIIHYDGEGDPYWQFVERDVPTVTGQVFAANVEMLTDFDGNIVGFTIYEASPANPAETQAGEVGK